MGIGINISDINIGIAFDNDGIRIRVRIGFDITHIQININVVVEATRLNTRIPLDASPIKRNHRTRCSEHRSFIRHQRGPILSVETE